MPRFAMLTVAQASSTATMVMTARMKTARPVRMVPTLPLTTRFAGVLGPRRLGMVTGGTPTVPGRRARPALSLGPRLPGARVGHVGRVNSARLDHEPTWPSAALRSAPSLLRWPRLMVHGPANGASPHLRDIANYLR